MRVITIVGARPQFVKAAPLSRALRIHHTEFLIHTGQHYDPNMSDVFFEELEIPRPDVNLGVGAMSNTEQIARMLLTLPPVLQTQHADWLIVYGDTNSTLAGAMAGRMLGIPVAHIEAGLRSYNRTMPEEMNRVLTDHISSALFCPTLTAHDNLKHEGITAQVYVVGDVMVDALMQHQGRISSEKLDEFGVASGRYFLATVHRASNTDNPDRLAGILSALGQLESPVLLPAHPRLHKALQQFQLRPGPNIHIIPPVGYVDMLSLTKSARLILTDSGGLQKEAYILRVPCITLRDETEWVETVQAGWNQLAGTDGARIIDCVRAVKIPEQQPNVYGDGRASERIVQTLAALC
jgi:UDP-GlcNAc3NAcA epimerase